MAKPYLSLFWIQTKQYFENIRIINHKKYLQKIIENDNFFTALYFLKLAWLRNTQWLLYFFLKLQKRIFRFRYRKHQKQLKRKRNIYAKPDIEKDRSDYNKKKVSKVGCKHSPALHLLMEKNLALLSRSSDKKIKESAPVTILWQRNLHAELYNPPGLQDPSDNQRVVVKNKTKMQG